MRKIAIAVVILALLGVVGTAAEFGAGIDFVAFTDPYIFAEYIINDIDQISIGEVTYNADGSLRLNFGISGGLMNVIVESRLWPFGRTADNTKVPIWFGLGAGLQPIPDDGFTTSFYVSVGTLLFNSLEFGFGILNNSTWQTMYINGGFSLTF